jgi:hypothetical protein
MNDQQRPDLPRDEHLRAALRHAPDAGVGAPADLGLKIRAAALRAATVAAAPPPPSLVVPSWPERLWSWLGQPGRMGASGAFATVLIATVIGMVWRSEVPPAEVQDEPGAARPQSSAGTTPDSRASAPSLGAANAHDAIALRATPPAAEQSGAKPDNGAGQSATASAEAKAARGRAASSADAAAAVAADQPAGPPASADAARSLSRDGSLASSRAIGGASRPDFAIWLDEAVKRNDATERLLAELAAFTRGRWLHSPEPPQDRHAVDLPVNGRTVATLTLGDDAVWGCLMTPDLRCQRAPLTPEQASRLRELFAQRR